MRILDKSTDKPLDEIILYLTKPEAENISQMLMNLLDGNSEHHSHFMDEEMKREVTVAIYSDISIETFDKRSQNLIRDGIKSGNTKSILKHY
jgi:hypothetical protein